jgi:hypothetical protein
MTALKNVRNQIYVRHGHQEVKYGFFAGARSAPCGVVISWHFLAFASSHCVEITESRFLVVLSDRAGSACEFEFAYVEDPVCDASPRDWAEPSLVFVGRVPP